MKNNNNKFSIFKSEFCLQILLEFINQKFFFFFILFFFFFQLSKSNNNNFFFLKKKEKKEKKYGNIFHILEFGEI